jgi:hypothetical protein
MTDHVTAQGAVEIARRGFDMPVHCDSGNRGNMYGYDLSDVPARHFSVIGGI